MFQQILASYGGGRARGGSGSDGQRGPVRLRDTGRRVQLGRAVPGTGLRSEEDSRRGLFRDQSPARSGVTVRSGHDRAARPRSGHGRAEAVDRRAAAGGGPRHADRVDLHRGVRVRGDRTARRDAGDHALAGRRGAGGAVPGAGGRPGRALRRQRAVPHVGGRGGGARPVPAHDPARPRLGGGGRRGAVLRDAAGTRGRAGAVHRDTARDASGCGAGTGAAVDGRQRVARTDAGRPRETGGHEHTDVEPALPRADRHDTAAVAASRTGPPGAAPAGDDDAPGGADREHWWASVRPRRSATGSSGSPAPHRRATGRLFRAESVRAAGAACRRRSTGRR